MIDRRLDRIGESVITEDIQCHCDPLIKLYPIEFFPAAMEEEVVFKGRQGRQHESFEGLGIYHGMIPILNHQRSVSHIKLKPVMLRDERELNYYKNHPVINDTTSNPNLP